MKKSKPSLIPKEVADMIGWTIFVAVLLFLVCKDWPW